MTKKDGPLLPSVQTCRASSLKERDAYVDYVIKLQLIAQVNYIIQLCKAKSASSKFSQQFTMPFHQM